jgi:CDP-glucose 4,6-dehydratase
VGSGRCALGATLVSTFFNDAYRGRRVLVTGHTGFKGSWLALWLHALGARVAGFSLDVPTRPSNFEALGLATHLEHHFGDIRERAAFARVVDEFRPEVIFHLAAQSLVQRSYAEPAATFETNALGMLNVLECVRTRSWIDTVVLITSDKSYRNEEWCWGYKETDALGGRDPYSGSKGCADLIAYSYFHSFLHEGPTRVGVARAGNVIGGGDWAEQRIVPDCVRAWSQGKSVSVRSPLATRPWQHVLEPLSGYLWLGARLLAGQAQINGEAFYFGPDAAVNQTVAQLLDAMTQRWPGAAWQAAGNAGGGHEAKLLKLSCDKALFYLNWRAVLGFTETVTFTVEWYRNWLQHQDQPVYAYGREQIERYAELARTRAVRWAAP